MPEVIWTKDGVLLNSTNPLIIDSSIQLLSDGEQLRIQRANINHAGSYVCSATNKVATTGITVQVTVILRPVMILSNQNGDQYDRFMEVFEGSSITFSCPVKQDNFDGNITWHKNSKLIEFNSNKFSTISFKMKMTLLVYVLYLNLFN